MKYKIIIKPNSCIDQLVNKIHTTLQSNGFCEDHLHPELIICIGGDGTLLHAVHEHLSLIDHAMFVAIHNGTLGFFTDYTIDEIDQFLEDVITKTPKIYEASILEAKIYSKDEVTTYHALNEVRIENVIQTQIVDISIDQEYFETIHGSGVCISTQSGSTAYNRSLGGGVVDSGLQLIQLCEITAIHHKKFHSLGVPYIMHPDRLITIKSNDYNHALFLYDHKYIPIEENSEIFVTTSKHKVRFARYTNYSYLQRLKNLY